MLKSRSLPYPEDCVVRFPLRRVFEPEYSKAMASHCRSEGNDYS